MPPVAFTNEIKIDGKGYRARRLDGSRQYSTSYVPQVAGQRAFVQLDPLNVADWGDGRGWGYNVDTSEGMIMPGPQVTAVALPSAPGADLEQFAEQDGHIYVVGGRYVYRIPSGTDPPLQDQDLGASFVAASIAPFKSSLIVGGRATGNIWEKPSAGAWTNTMVGAAVQRGMLASVYWNVAGSPGVRLVGEATPTSVSYVAANPRLNTDWVAALTIGSYPVKSVVASRTHVYFGTTGGLIDIDSTGEAPNLTPEIERMIMDTNGRATLAADGWIYINAGHTLKRVRGVGQEYAQVQDVGWSAQIPKQCPMAGYVTALAKHGRWLWAAIYDGTNTWVCKAREAISGLDQVGPLVWFAAPVYLAGVKVTALHVSGLVSQNPRLWMATLTGSTRALAWAYLPMDSAYRDLRQARPYRFATSFQYDEPEEDHGDDALVKFFREVVAESENLGVGTQDILSIAVDGAAPFSTIGTLRANPRAVVRPPSTILASRYILRHTGSGTTVTPPVVRKRSTRVIPRPDLLEVRTYQVVVGLAVRSGDGAVDGRSVKATKTTLAGLQRGGPISFSDEHQTSLSALISAGETFTQVEAQLGDDKERQVLVADLQVAVLATYGGSAFTIGDGTLVGDLNKVLA